MRSTQTATLKRSLAPVYQRLFRRFFDATISRLNDVMGELVFLRAELTDTHADLAAVRADVVRLIERIDQLVAERHNLEDQLRSVLAAHSDDIALARRLARLEDRIGESGLSDHEGESTPEHMRTERVTPR